VRDSGHTRIRANFGILGISSRLQGERAVGSLHTNQDTSKVSFHLDIVLDTRLKNGACLEELSVNQEFETSVIKRSGFHCFSVGL
jgi:hypothetical protein